jgi:hypothetical protein
MVEYRESRDREFYEACRRGIKNARGRIDLSEIVRNVIHSPASSFFLSERQYGRIIRAKEHDMPRSESGAALFNEIRALYKKIRISYPNMSMEAISRDIISVQGAPRFYISVARGMNIYYSTFKRIKKHRDEKE